MPLLLQGRSSGIVLFGLLGSTMSQVVLQILSPHNLVLSGHLGISIGPTAMFILSGCVRYVGQESSIPITGHQSILLYHHGIVGQASSLSGIPSPSLSLMVFVFSMVFACALMIFHKLSSQISPIPLRLRSSWFGFCVKGQLSNVHIHCICSLSRS